jgi:hypothetical protein
MSLKPPTTTARTAAAAVNQKRNEREKAKNNNNISIKQSPAVWIFLYSLILSPLTCTASL